MITIQLYCVEVGLPGEPDVYEPVFVDTETEECSHTLLVDDDNTIKIGDGL